MQGKARWYKPAAAKKALMKRITPASARVRERDLLFVLRRDKRKLERVRELLEVWEEQKEARHGKAPEAYEKDDAEDDDPLAGV